MKQWEEVKQKLNIVDIISSYTPLQKAGRNYKGLCPFHQENTPSFMVSSELQIFKCFGCGEGGDVFEFVKKIEGLEFADTLRLLADKAGIKLEPYTKDPESGVADRILDINSKALLAYSYFLNKHTVGNAAKEYLAKRGLSEKTIKEFNLGYSPKSWNTLTKYLMNQKYTLSDIGLAGLAVIRGKDSYFDFFRGRVMIPLLDARGQAVGFSGRVLDPKDSPKYINTIESPVFHKGKFLFGLSLTRQQIKKSGWALVVEGDFGLITLYQMGIKNVVALKGTAFTQEQLKLLGRYTKKLVLFLDSDEAGVQAALKSAFLAQDLGFSVKVVSPKQEKKDPDDLAKEDFDAFKKLLDNPLDVYDFAIETYRKKYDLRSGADKREFSQKILAILSQIKDPVEQRHYIKKLALILETDEALLAGLIGRPTSLPVSPVLPKAFGSTLKLRLSQESYFLALMFKAPLDIAQKQVYKAGKNDFSNKHYLEIFEALKEYLIGRKSVFNPQTFRGKVGEECRGIFDELYLEDLSFLGDSPDSWDKESEVSLKELKRVAVKREMRAITFEIKRREAAGEETDDLQEKFNGLKDKLLN